MGDPSDSACHARRLERQSRELRRRGGIFGGHKKSAHKIAHTFFETLRPKTYSLV